MPNAVVTTKAKMWMAAIGSTLTALTTALATVTLMLDDDAIDITEISTLVIAVLTLVTGVWAVWRVPNKLTQPIPYRSGPNTVT